MRTSRGMRGGVAVGSALARRSMGSCSGSGQVSLGGICLPGSASGRRYMTGTGVGPRRGLGSGYCGSYKPTPTWEAVSTGAWSVWTRPSAVPISMRQHAAGARRRVPRVPGRRRRPAQHRCDEGLGRSRGGFTCKIHVAGEGGRRPLAFVSTPGQWGDAPEMLPVLDRVRVPRPRSGHPRTRPDHVCGDRAYSSRRNRRYLRRRKIKQWPPSGSGRGRNALPSAAQFVVDRSWCAKVRSMSQA